VPKLLKYIHMEEVFMTKADLVDQIVTLGDLTRRDGEVIVETLFDSIVEALKSSDKVEVRGFGSFRTRQRQPRTGRNPKTGASVAVPAKRVPFFKPSKELRDLVNPGEAKGQRRSASAGQKSNPSDVIDIHHPPAM
jgi:integration host factor subunit beta